MKSGRFCLPGKYKMFLLREYCGFINNHSTANIGNVLTRFMQLEVNICKYTIYHFVGKLSIKRRL